MSTLTTTILNALASEGIEAVEVETVKNGIIFSGIKIDNGKDVNPVLYYSSEETVDEFVQRAREIAQMTTPELDPINLICRERLLNDTTLCVQKRGYEQIVKEEYLNLEAFVRLNVDFANEANRGSIKVTKQMIESAGITEEELFAAAKMNSEERVRISSMAEMLGAPDELFDDVPFYVGTYIDRCNGSGILALPRILKNFCEEKGFEQIYLLPSSTEEILILPNENADPVELSKMVNDINLTAVNPIYRLDPVVYIFDNPASKITIAASFGGEYISTVA